MEKHQYLKHKLSLSSPAISMQFMRLRPQNFPTIRLVQLASLYALDSTGFRQDI